MPTTNSYSSSSNSRSITDINNNNDTTNNLVINTNNTNWVYDHTNNNTKKQSFHNHNNNHYYNNRYKTYRSNSYYNPYKKKATMSNNRNIKRRRRRTEEDEEEDFDDNDFYDSDDDDDDSEYSANEKDDDDNDDVDFEKKKKSASPTAATSKRTRETIRPRRNNNNNNNNNSNNNKYKKSYLNDCTSVGSTNNIIRMTSSSISSCSETDTLNDYEKHILSKLRPFQREAYEFATRGRPLSSSSSSSATNKNNPYYDPALLGKGRILLADEMGLGKTVTSLAIMAHYKDEWPLLILCPASLRYTWPTEIEKFLPMIPPKCIHVISGWNDVAFLDRLQDNDAAKNDDDSNNNNKIKIVIATYSLLQGRSAVGQTLLQQRDGKKSKFKCMIVDESHNLRTKTSQRSKMAMELFQQAQRLVLLSGTPALAKPVELFVQLHSLYPKSLFEKNYTAYTRKYCAPKFKFGRWDVSGLSNAKELNQKLQQIMVRRLKSDVLHELPPKQRRMVPIDSSAITDKGLVQDCRKQIQELNDARLTLSQLIHGNNDEQELNDLDFDAKRLLTQAYQTTGIVKAQAVADYLVDWLMGSGTQKVLVFAHHKAVMDGIESVLLKQANQSRSKSSTATKTNKNNNNNNNNPYQYIRIDGTVPPKERSQLVQKFQTSPHVRVAVLSMTAAGVGLTLTAASTVMFAELHWTPAILAQAEDRCHRIGQVNSVNILYFVCNDTSISVDVQLWNMLGRKIGTLDKVINGGNGKNNSMDAKIVQDENEMTQLGLSSSLSQQQQQQQQQQSSSSVQDELINFFAETAVDNGTATNEKDRSSNKKNEPVVVGKGSIMSFFQKQPKTSAAAAATTNDGVRNNNNSNNNKSKNADVHNDGDTTAIASAMKDNTGVVEWACPVCTFLNSSSLSMNQKHPQRCEMCHSPYNNNNNNIDNKAKAETTNKITNSSHSRGNSSFHAPLEKNIDDDDDVGGGGNDDDDDDDDDDVKYAVMTTTATLARKKPLSSNVSPTSSFSTILASQEATKRREFDNDGDNKDKDIGSNDEVLVLVQSDDDDDECLIVTPNPSKLLGNNKEPPHVLLKSKQQLSLPVTPTIINPKKTMHPKRSSRNGKKYDRNRNNAENEKAGKVEDCNGDNNDDRNVDRNDIIIIDEYPNVDGASKATRGQSFIVIDDDDSTNSESSSSGSTTPKRHGQQQHTMIVHPIIDKCNDRENDNDSNSNNTNNTPSRGQKKKQQHQGRQKIKSKNQKQQTVAVLSFSVSKNSGRVMIHYASTGSPSCINFDVHEILTEESVERLSSVRVKRSYERCNKQRSKKNAEKKTEFNETAVQKLIKSLDLPNDARHSKGEQDNNDGNKTNTPESQQQQQQQCGSELKEFVSAYLSLREIERKAIKESGEPIVAKNVHQSVAKLLLNMKALTEKNVSSSRNMTTTSGNNNSVRPGTERFVGGARERAKQNLQQGIATKDDIEVLSGSKCAWCGINSLSEALKSVNSIYCSQSCTEQGRLRSGGMFGSTNIRKQLFALEGGVCQICGVDAHALFLRMKALEHPSERFNLLQNANWKIPKTKQSIDRLTHNPEEGDFWQADHIVAVTEGGGSCGLDNLRTLCVPCHHTETEKLRARLKLLPNAEDSHDTPTPAGAMTDRSDMDACKGKDATTTSKNKRRQMDIRSIFTTCKRQKR